MHNKTIYCPNCNKQHNWLKSKPWSPFCSERCKLIDLGDWAAEKHRIAAEPVDEEQLEQLKNKLN